MLARRFLYIIAALIILVLALGLAWSLMQDRLMRMAFVPSIAFSAMPDSSAPDYATPAPWVARPDFSDDPSRRTPAGFASPDRKQTAEPQAAIFYIAPTTY